jgi:heme oxygenase
VAVFDDAVCDLPSVLGALYVTEGATLGGAVIAPHLRSTLAAPVPLAFFEAYADQVGTRWAEFRRVTRSTLTDHDEIDRAVTAARAVFEQFAEALAA